MCTVLPHVRVCTALCGIFPAWLIPLVLDSKVPTNQVALLFACDHLIRDRQGEDPGRPAFVQQRDVAFWSNLDRKTIFGTRHKDGRTLIERCGDHGLDYTPGSSDRLLLRQGGEVGEAGSYGWSSPRPLDPCRSSCFEECQNSPTDSSKGVVVAGDLAPGGDDLGSWVIAASTEKPRDCGGNLTHPDHGGRDDEGLAALVNPAAMIWESKQSSLNAWRATCVLLGTWGPGPVPLTASGVSERLGVSRSTGFRLLGKLEQQKGLVRREGTGWVFDTSELLRTRRRSMEGKRDVILGPFERRGRKDLGVPLDNSLLSRDYIQGHKDGWSSIVERGQNAHLMKQREALLAMGEESQADQRWLERIRNLNHETVGAYLSPEGGRRRSLDTPLAASEASVVSHPAEPPDDGMLERLRAMSDRVNGLGLAGNEIAEQALGPPRTQPPLGCPVAAISRSA